MKIRTRVSLWYACILLVSLFLMDAVLYYELVVEPAQTNDAGLPDQPIDEEIAEVVLFYGLPTAFFLLGGGWWLMGRALTPLNHLTQAAERIQVDTLHERLPRSENGDELDRLAGVLNRMMARLEDSFTQIRDFTLHASHELKTPLAVLHVELETLLNDPATSAAQREALASHLDEIQRLSRIVSGLTLLARADAGQFPFAHEPVRLDELVRNSHADAIILAHTRNIQVDLEDCSPVLVRGDRHRLRQLLLNLTDNAVKYCQPGGRVAISLRTSADEVKLQLSNTGAGIPPEHLPRVCERFFRGETAPGEDAEGCGLGLSIAQWIAHAHQGTISFESEPGTLTKVTVRLPVSDRVNDFPDSSPPQSR